VTRSEREKGARGEREVAAIFRAHGFAAVRTPNSGGLAVKGDLAGVPAHVEVKRQEVARPWSWWAQASSEAPSGVMPLVAFRRERADWLAIVRLDDVAALLAGKTPDLGTAWNMLDAELADVSKVARRKKAPRRAAPPPYDPELEELCGG
jgi:hypothetical protein